MSNAYVKGRETREKSYIPHPLRNHTTCIIIIENKIMFCRGKVVKVVVFNATGERDPSALMAPLKVSISFLIFPSKCAIRSTP